MGRWSMRRAIRHRPHWARCYPPFTIALNSSVLRTQCNMVTDIRIIKFFTIFGFSHFNSFDCFSATPQFLWLWMLKHVERDSKFLSMSSGWDPGLNVPEHGSLGAHHVRPARPPHAPPYSLHSSCHRRVQRRGALRGLELSSWVSSKTDPHHPPPASWSIHSPGDISHLTHLITCSRWSPTRWKWSSAPAPATCQAKHSTSAVWLDTPKI